jgi:amidophosphoribosyltransferase
VRGTTSKKIVQMVREAGASEVHMRISCPADSQPVLLRRRYAAQSELIAAQMSVAEVCNISKPIRSVIFLWTECANPSASVPKRRARLAGTKISDLNYADSEIPTPNKYGEGVPKNITLQVLARNSVLKRGSLSNCRNYVRIIKQ